MAKSPSSPSPSSPHRSPQPIAAQMKPQPSPWTNEETTNLIQAYQEKWYSLKKGPLKSSQWEEVSVTVAALCGYEEPSKSAIQCRHKMEKLRKRYRAELQLRRPSVWPFFNLMDRLTIGPLPISAQPMTTIKYQKSPDHVNNNDDEDSGEDEPHNKSRSLDYILRTPTNVDRKLNEAATERIGDFRKRSEPSHTTAAVTMEEPTETALAAEITSFAEKFVRMENVKIEMMREIERYRIEMENKRTEMILNSHRKIVDTIGKALGSSKKMKIATVHQ